MLGLALANLLLSGDPAPVEAAPVDVEAGFHRGTGWYSTTAIPEPPFALALVIVGVAGMRAYERRLQRRGI